MPIKRAPRKSVGTGGEKSPPSSAKGLQTSAKPGIAKRVPRKPKFALGGEIAEVMGVVNKKYAPGIIRSGSDTNFTYGRLPTRILAIDLALAGGWQLSRGVMAYGEKSTGKSTLAIMTVREAQARDPDGVAVWVDIEGTFDKTWAVKHGVDLDRLIILEPETGEQAVDLADAAFRAQETLIIVTDSIAMLTPMKEIESSAEDNLMGVHARLVGNYIRRLNMAMLKERHRGHNPIVFHINQFRTKLGVMFGDPRTLPGGKALEYATSQQLETKNKEHKGKDEYGNELVVFNEHSFNVTKDKTGGRIKEGKFKLIRDPSTGYPEGHIEQTRTVMKFAADAGLYVGGGSSHTLTIAEKDWKFRKIEEIGQFLLERPDRLHHIQDEIIAFYRNKWGVST